MLLELLTLFKNLALRVATVCSAGTQLNISRQTSTTSCDLVSKTFLKVLLITKYMYIGAGRDVWSGLGVTILVGNGVGQSL